MRRLLLIGLVGIGLLNPSLFQVDATTADNYLPLKAGNYWAYELVLPGQKVLSECQVMEAESIDGQAVLITEILINQITIQREYCYLTKNGLFTINWFQAPFNFKFQPHQQGLKYPVVIGDSWEQSGTMVDTEQGLTFIYNSQYTYQAWEELQVPAGSFKALKLQFSEVYSNGMRLEGAQYLVNDIGVVKEEVTLTIGSQTVVASSQLVSYKLN